MHGPAEPTTEHKPALQPNAAIGPALRAIAGNILAKGRIALTDPECSNEAAVHDFRRAMKQWRALMRLLEPFIPDADRWRREARDHARSLAHARERTPPTFCKPNGTCERAGRRGAGAALSGG